MGLPSPPPDDASHGSALCTACGLCCTGLLFDLAPLEERDLELAARLHLPLACTRHHDAFRLPCPCHRERRCTVYETRPSVCASYACGLLRRLEAGEVTAADAHARVHQVHALVDALRHRVPQAERPRPLWDDAAEHMRCRDAEEPAPAWQEERASLVEALAALRATIRRALDP